MYLLAMLLWLIRTACIATMPTSRPACASHTDTHKWEFSARDTMHLHHQLAIVAELILIL